MARAHGFPRFQRLRSQHEIGEVFRRGQYDRLGLLQAKSLPSPRGLSRFMVSVRRKAGSAPQRNRIKRIVREAVRLNKDRLRTPHDVCFFVTARPQQHVRLATIEPEVRNLFDRLSQRGDALASDG